MPRIAKTSVFIVASLVFTALISLSACFASDISFSGGYTRVSLQEGYRTVQLSEKAVVRSQSLELNASQIDLSGENYRYVDCKGQVKVRDSEKRITITSPKLSYDRVKETMIADGWVQVEDLENEAVLSCSRLEYESSTEIMKLSMLARIVKSTDKGILDCRADSMVFDNKAQTLTLKGAAEVVWGESRYSAAVIFVNLQTEEIQLYGSISGDVNG